MTELEKQKLELDKVESERRVRQRCLELAIPNSMCNNIPECDKTAEEILKRAEKYAQFILGK